MKAIDVAQGQRRDPCWVNSEGCRKGRNLVEVLDLSLKKVENRKRKVKLG